MSANANSIYGNLTNNSLFMTPGHEIKIAGLEWVSAMNSGPIFDFLQNWQQISHVKQDLNKLPLYAADAYMLSEYIKSWSEELARPINQIGKCWNFLSNKMPEPKELLELEIWSSDKFSQMLTFLKELPLKDNLQRQVFFKDLVDYADIFSPPMQAEAIIPELIKALSFSQTPAILQPIFALSSSMDKESFTSKVIPKVTELFSIRSTELRLELLSQMPKIVPNVDKSIANDVIFREIFPGLNDVLVRQATIIAMVPLAPLLTSDNISALMRTLDRLQEVDDAQVRTNSVICLAKISEYIEKVQFLAQAFAKSARDGFAPARKASVAAMKSCLPKFNSGHIAQILVPALGPLLIDQVEEVRIPALRLMAQILEGLSANDKEKIEEENQNQQIPQKPAPVKPKTVLNLSNVEKGGWDEIDVNKPLTATAKTSKTVKKPRQITPKPKAAVVAEIDDEDGWGDLEDADEDKKPQPKTVVKPKPIVQQKIQPKVVDIDVDDEENGWGDFDEPEKVTPVKSQTVKPKVVTKPVQKQQKIEDDDEENGWGEIEEKPKTVVKPKSSLTQKKPVSTSKPLVLKSTKKAEEDDEDGWGDLDDAAIIPQKTKETQPRKMTKPVQKVAKQQTNKGDDDDDNWGNLYDKSGKKQIRPKKSVKAMKVEEIDDAEWGDWDDAK
ncbi:hypothetical protein TVAG_469010 [Trichomonas vaginalis G3]|uniref:HEAT repeat family protein n=3 Tax=Trichomonas vaginalis (strain ATCC PRA-98 / G3) TaxID=412133 RepID=A2FD72_TRIV3|nr:hypothetical protein TVAG_469010 [Trichomonas vaginalis G3]|eukprot:XP_001310058.1 hypothetical protein [Trichomonas vaginalis G3]